jgi:hypothetical protein
MPSETLSFCDLEPDSNQKAAVSVALRSSQTAEMSSRMILTVPEGHASRLGATMKFRRPATAHRWSAKGQRRAGAVN